MSEIRMSDVFELPVCTGLENLSEFLCVTISDNEDVTEEQAAAIDNAINQHDKLTDRVKELEKAADNLLWRCIESDSDVADSDAWHELERLIK